MLKNVAPALQRTDDAPGSLAQRVAGQIRQAILDGEVQLGEALSELKLSAALGVSRTPVREALNALQREGLIDIRPQSGSFVFLPSEEDVGELCEFRRILETTALRLCHARHHDATLQQLRAASDAMEAAQRSGAALDMARADSAFHQALARNCGNAYIVEAYKLVSGRVAALLTHNVSGPATLRDKSIAEHRALIAAFAKGDLDTAEDILDEHVSRMRVGFRSALRRDSKGPRAVMQILSITAPIYLIIAAGFLCVRQGIFSKADTRALGRFVVLMCVPAQLFLTLSRRPLGEVMDAGFVAAYTLGSLAMLLGTTAYARRLRGWPMPRAAMLGLGSSASNSVFIGFPIAQQVVGPAASVALALCVLIENLLIMPAALALADSASGAQRWHRALGEALLGLLKNPMILAILAGAACAAFGVQIPDVPARTVQMLGTAAAGTALFVVGGALVGLNLDGVRSELTGLAAAKLLLHPLAVWLCLQMLPAIDPLLAMAAVIFAAMPMLSLFPVLAQKYGLESLSAAALLVATVLSFASVGAVLWALRLSGAPSP